MQLLITSITVERCSAELHVTTIPAMCCYHQGKPFTACQEMRVYLWVKH